MTAVTEPFESHFAGPTGARMIRLQPSATCGQPVPVQASAADSHADSLRDIALASARLERLQWEMDSVEEELCAALRRASDTSVSAAALARAAGVSLPELEDYLQRPAMEPAGAGSYFSIAGL
ncbi:hypothetical protein ACLH0K_04875 [Arthrobacter sp. MPF02]|uniref:hypothetical protein n=1 Tax=Arthrobacter sp. MPF02 TaxID=3388492 RepID=UPI00398506E4